jgi:hypothetical protein
MQHLVRAVLIVCMEVINPFPRVVDNFASPASIAPKSLLIPVTSTRASAVAIEHAIQCVSSVGTSSTITGPHPKDLWACTDLVALAMVRDPFYAGVIIERKAFSTTCQRMHRILS